MIIETLKTLYSRELHKLKAEIELYQNEKRIWHFEKSISNSAGNLCLHLTGNLNAYIGAGLAKTSYTRHRELEFSLKDIPKAELIKKVEETILVVEKGLNSLSDDQMKDNFPVVIWDKATEMEYTLVHLITHVSYHLGQINYHRRLLDE
jgi:uncharacterized damage-inducible protein DinB